MRLTVNVHRKLRSFVIGVERGPWRDWSRLFSVGWPHGRFDVYLRGVSDRSVEAP